MVGVPAVMRFRGSREEAREEKTFRRRTRGCSKKEKTKSGGAVHHVAIRRALRQHSGDPEVKRSKQLE